VLAWSTVSQLAYMVAALGVGGREAATFHLLTHAFFKALLFLAAGAVIHVVGSNLMKDMGGLRRGMPITFWTMTVGLFSLAGLPPLAGWFSKESILVAAEHAAAGEAGVQAWTGWLVLVVGLVTVAVTAAYAVRLWARTFLGRCRSDVTVHEAPALMRWPLVALAVPSVGFGFLGLSAAWLPTWTFPTATSPVAWVAYAVGAGEIPEGAVLPVEALQPELLTVVLSLAALLVGGGSAWLAWSHAPAADPADRLGRLRPTLEGGYGVDSWYQGLAVAPFGWAVRAVRAVDDRVVVPAVQGTGRAAVLAGAAVQRVQRGDVQRYLTASGSFIVAAVVVVVVAVTT
jgi:NADH-quinone oxidoreductase subunit L